MCGIVGYLSENIVKKENFLELVNSLKHRGPDDYGIFEEAYKDQKVFLGHTRLSIIDLSHNGHQPMQSDCSRYIIIFNGEIYNFKELKEILLSKGYLFRSKSDTEVILNGFIEYKQKLFEMLNGMYAIAIYDKVEGKIFLARDKSGMKPLYYIYNGKELIFSSEIKVLRAYSSGINTDAKILFLLLGYVPEPLTIYNDIKIFRAGSYAIYDLNNRSFESFEFDKYEFLPKVIDSDENVLKNVRTLLEDSISRHLISDANIGVFLSGGVDSSVLTALSSKYVDKLNTVSLVFEDKILSEEKYQDLMAQRYKTNHTKYLVTQKVFLDTFNDFFDSLDQPSVDGYNTYLVSKASKELGLKVVLSGVGGDEIFYGYRSFRKTKKLKDFYNFYRLFIPLLQKTQKLKKFEFLRFNEQIRYYLVSRCMFSPVEVSKILDISVGYIYKVLDTFFNNHIIDDFNKLDNNDITAYYELNMYMKNQLLRDSDVFSMKNSIEIRIPFLDKELLDYILKIESNKKFGEINKQLLVDSVRDLLPQEVYNRDKKGFELPYKNWFRNNIDNINISDGLKNKFLNGNLHWSRVYALMVLERFEK